MPDPDHPVRALQRLVDDDPSLATMLRRSLTQARERAEGEMRPSLFEALDWPTDLADYYDYLRRFVRWIPQQSDAPAWKDAGPRDRWSTELSDRMSHFYWLVDQKVDVGETAAAEHSEPFRDWLTTFAREWGSFLDTPESFSQEILDSFIEHAPQYHVEESMVDGRPNMPRGWLTFNQFFARQLNAGLRPVAEPHDNAVVTSPADCSLAGAFDIDARSNIPGTTIKKTHKYGNVRQLMAGSEYADAFASGTFAHYMLPPSAYHRYHLPVAGRVVESFVTQGRVFVQVDLEDGELEAKDSAHTGYEFSQTRGVVTVDTSTSGCGDLGLVTVIPVGMAHVSSVKLTTVEGSEVAKGEEFGFFQFGGSDIIVLFQEDVDPRIDTSEGFRLVGSPIARAPRRGESA